ncbi:hypothetical protein FNV43_RR16774 [Rhamnella rubrinervis]|uniref:Uncharacterized protein n=1 Tax=Rhamnella rubrinervis TaxID=2594499 RepID=A0A8K0GZG0_9ROSA|nr:hypothetical protein FNV43_RR16774 [Rhamnella rubrinervis]
MSTELLLSTNIRLFTQLATFIITTSASSCGSCTPLESASKSKVQILPPSLGIMLNSPHNVRVDLLENFVMDVIKGVYYWKLPPGALKDLELLPELAKHEAGIEGATMQHPCATLLARVTRGECGGLGGGDIPLSAC